MERDQQETIYQFNLLEQQIQQISKQIQAIEKGIVELNEINKGLEELKGSKDKEIMASLGKGIFIKSKIISEDLIVDIGEKSFVKKTIPQTKELVENQIETLKEIKRELESDHIKVERELEKIIESIQK